MKKLLLAILLFSTPAQALDRLVAGDSIALGLGAQLNRGCRISARECVVHRGFWWVDARIGIPSAAVIRRVRDDDWVVISAGSNDARNPRLLANLRTMRAIVHGRVIWIVPRNRRAAAIVTAVAREFGDQTIRFAAARDGVHPRSYVLLARQVQAIVRAAQVAVSDDVDDANEAL